jgi:transposase
MDGRRPTYDELQAENAALRERVAVLEAQVARLTAQVESLLQRLEEKDRTGKRQAAPFSKGPPKPDPKPPGRKPGDNYGQHHRRAIPEQPPDEIYDVPLPAECPACRSTRLIDAGTQSQWQTDLPTRPLVRRFDIHCGHCAACGEPVQGRHALQTSDALGAAASQLGPHVHAATALLNKELGLSHGKIARLMQLLFGITLHRSTSCRSILRTAAKCQPAYAEIEARVRGSPVLGCDETGWKLGGVLHWLHVCVADEAVLYRIDRRRGHQVLAELIGQDYAGTLIHDGLASYDRFWRAAHQQCLAHLLKRCRELLETATAGATRFPRAVKGLLQRSLSVRDRFLAGELTPAGLSSLRGRLRAALERLVAFLEQHRDEVFQFLTHPETISATNNESEFELRFNVIARKLSGGNRTTAGSVAQMTLPSITRTCRKLGREPYEFLRHTLCSTTPLPLYTTAGAVN